MKLLLALIGIFVVSNNSNLTSFDNSSYVENIEIATMLNEQFVKEIDSRELYSTLENYLENHFDHITHVNGHFEKESKVFYYTVYGTQDNVKKFDFFEVDEKLFSSEGFYAFENKLALAGYCKKGFGSRIFPTFCPGTSCQVQAPCVGITCRPIECALNE